MQVKKLNDAVVKIALQAKNKGTLYDKAKSIEIMSQFLYRMVLCTNISEKLGLQFKIALDGLKPTTGCISKTFSSLLEITLALDKIVTHKQQKRLLHV